jgi:hypothetical protein
VPAMEARDSQLVRADGADGDDLVGTSAPPGGSARRRRGCGRTEPWSMVRVRWVRPERVELGPGGAASSAAAPGKKSRASNIVVSPVPSCS